MLKPKKATNKWTNEPLDFISKIYQRTVKSAYYYYYTIMLAHDMSVYVCWWKILLTLTTRLRLLYTTECNTVMDTIYYINNNNGQRARETEKYLVFEQKMK